MPTYSCCPYIRIFISEKTKTNLGMSWKKSTSTINTSIFGAYTLADSISIVSYSTSVLKPTTDLAIFTSKKAKTDLNKT